MQFSLTASGEADGLEVLDEGQNNAIVTALIAYTPSPDYHMLHEPSHVIEDICSTSTVLQQNGRWPVVGSHRRSPQYLRRRQRQPAFEYVELNLS